MWQHPISSPICHKYKLLGTKSNLQFYICKPTIGTYIETWFKTRNWDLWVGLNFLKEIENAIVFVWLNVLQGWSWVRTSVINHTSCSRKWDHPLWWGFVPEHVQWGFSLYNLLEICLIDIGRSICSSDLLGAQCF